MRMFHLGGPIMLDRGDIVGIFDLDTTTVSKHSRDFLRHAQGDAVVSAVGDDLPKTFVVTSTCRAAAGTAEIQAAQRVFLSPHSSAALMKKLLTIP